jgi:plastocyanin
MKTATLLIFLLLNSVKALAAASQQKPPETIIVITLENHHFSPSEVHFPSGQPVVLLIKNRDATAEEFESAALKVEKILAAKGETVVHLRPTEHGHYTFVGEHHEKVARGVLIAD